MIDTVSKDGTTEEHDNAGKGHFGLTPGGDIAVPDGGQGHNGPVKTDGVQKVPLVALVPGDPGLGLVLLAFLSDSKPRAGEQMRNVEHFQQEDAQVRKLHELPDYQQVLVQVLLDLSQVLPFQNEQQRRHIPPKTQEFQPG